MVWSTKSRTNTSVLSFVSPGTRLEAPESKATYRPFAEMDGRSLMALPWWPAVDTLTRVVVLVMRSRTKTSPLWFVSPCTRFGMSEANTTRRPSPEMSGNPA